MTLRRPCISGGTASRLRFNPARRDFNYGEARRSCNAEAAGGPNSDTRSVSLLCCLLASLALAGCREEGAAPPTEITVAATLSTNAIHVGDVIAFTAQVDHPDTTRVEFPPDDKTGKVAIRDDKTTVTAVAPGWKRTERKASVTSFELGDHAVATGMVRIVAADGAVTEKWLPDTRFTVASSLASSNEPPRAIKGLAQWPQALPVRIGLILLAALAAVVLAALIARWLRRQQAVLSAPKPAPLPHEIALAALQALLGRNYIETENVEPFYIELSGIVRTYIEGRFNLRAPELTTEEFIREATSSHHLSLDHQQLTTAFLEQCDLVKFAKHKPAQADMRAAFSAAERLVKETIPPPPPTLDTRHSVPS